jgi:hypothetical protein
MSSKRKTRGSSKEKDVSPHQSKRIHAMPEIEEIVDDTRSLDMPSLPPALEEATQPIPEEIYEDAAPVVSLDIQRVLSPVGEIESDTDIVPYMNTSVVQNDQHLSIQLSDHDRPSIGSMLMEYFGCYNIHWSDIAKLNQPLSISVKASKPDAADRIYWNVNAAPGITQKWNNEYVRTFQVGFGPFILHNYYGAPHGILNHPNKDVKCKLSEKERNSYQGIVDPLTRWNEYDSIEHNTDTYNGIAWWSKNIDKQVEKAFIAKNPGMIWINKSEGKSNVNSEEDLEGIRRFMNDGSASPMKRLQLYFQNRAFRSPSTMAGSTDALKLKQYRDKTLDQADMYQYGPRNQAYEELFDKQLIMHNDDIEYCRAATKEERMNGKHGLITIDYAEHCHSVINGALSYITLAVTSVTGLEKSKERGLRNKAMKIITFGDFRNFHKIDPPTFGGLVDSFTYEWLKKSKQELRDAVYKTLTHDEEQEKNDEIIEELKKDMKQRNKK